MNDLQTQVNELKSRLEQLSRSRDISRDDETSLRERLGLTTNLQAFPVGSIFISTLTTNPATLLGYGTWTAFGDGQVLVSYKSGDSDFGTMGATGGEKNHTLTTNEMPAHTHTTGQSLSGSGLTGFGSGSSSTTSTTGSAGLGLGHNNLQPFIVVQFWKRTA